MATVSLVTRPVQLETAVKEAGVDSKADGARYACSNSTVQRALRALLELWARHYTVFYILLGSDILPRTCFQTLEIYVLFSV
jgi:hypothetical protein